MILSTFVLYSVHCVGVNFFNSAFLLSLTTAHTYFLYSSLARISYFPSNIHFASPSWPTGIYCQLQCYPYGSPICHPSGPAKLLERCSCSSRGVDAAGGHVLGVTVKQASNDTPCNHSKGGPRVTSANPGNALVGHRVIGTVPCNLGREAGKSGQNSCTCLSLAVGQPHSTTEMTKRWRAEGDRVPKRN